MPPLFIAQASVKPLAPKPLAPKAESQAQARAKGRASRSDAFNKASKSGRSSAVEAARA